MFTFETIPLGSTVTYTDSKGEVKQAFVYKKVERFKSKWNKDKQEFDKIPVKTISVEYQKTLYPGGTSKWPYRVALSKFTNITAVE